MCRRNQVQSLQRPSWQAHRVAPSARPRLIKQQLLTRVSCTWGYFGLNDSKSQYSIGLRVYDKDPGLQSVHVQTPQRARQADLPSELGRYGGVVADQLQLPQPGEPGDVQSAEARRRSQPQHEAKVQPVQLSWGRVNIRLSCELRNLRRGGEDVKVHCCHFRRLVD